MVQGNAHTNPVKDLKAVMFLQKTLYSFYEVLENPEQDVIQNIPSCQKTRYDALEGS